MKPSGAVNKSIGCHPESFPCHSERSEEKFVGTTGILRFAQNDNVQTFLRLGLSDTSSHSCPPLHPHLRRPGDGRSQWPESPAMRRATVAPKPHFVRFMARDSCSKVRLICAICRGDFVCFQ